MKLILPIFLLIFSCTLSQSRPVLNQYMLHQSTYNPGYLDPTTKFSVATLYRRQWMQQNNFPEIGYLYGHYNFNRSHGLGMIISNDLMNGINQFEAAANYIYNIPLANSFNIGLGLRAGISEQNMLDPKLTYFDEVEPTLSGPSTFTYFNTGFGASVSSKTFEAHLSMPFLFGNKFLDKAKVYSTVYNHFYFSTGYKFRFSDWFIMYPTAIVSAVKGSRVHGNLNVNFLSSQLVWYGFGMSTDLAVNFSVGIFTMGGLRVIYSYDTSFFTKHLNTGITHEISISYGKTIESSAFNKRKSKKRFKSGSRWG